LRALVYNSHSTLTRRRGLRPDQDGVLKKGQRIRLMPRRSEHEVNELGQFRPTMTVCGELSAGRSATHGPDQKTWATSTIGDTGDRRLYRP